MHQLKPQMLLRLSMGFHLMVFTLYAHITVLSFFFFFPLCLLIQLKSTNCLNRFQLGFLIHNDLDLYKLYMTKKVFNENGSLGLK